MITVVNLIKTGKATGLYKKKLIISMIILATWIHVQDFCNIYNYDSMAY